MGKEIHFADSNFKKQLAEFMQLINPKPTGAALEALREKLINERAAYQERKANK